MGNFVKLKLVDGKNILINIGMIESIEELESSSEISMSFSGKTYHVEEEASEVEKKISKADKFTFRTS